MKASRFEQMKTLFAREGYHALLCRIPQLVLLFTGYQPVLGDSFCLVSLNTSQELEIRLAVPADERDLVPSGGAIEVKTFTEETMDYIGNAPKEILHSGMVHNMEPAVYLDGKGGLRLNDNVAVHMNGNEVLSAALSRDLDWLVVAE